MLGREPLDGHEGDLATPVAGPRLGLLDDFASNAGCFVLAAAADLLDELVPGFLLRQSTDLPQSPPRLVAKTLQFRFQPLQCLLTLRDPNVAAVQLRLASGQLLHLPVEAVLPVLQPPLILLEFVAGLRQFAFEFLTALRKGPLRLELALALRGLRFCGRLLAKILGVASGRPNRSAGHHPDQNHPADAADEEGRHTDSDGRCK